MTKETYMAALEAAFKYVHHMLGNCYELESDPSVLLVMLDSLKMMSEHIGYGDMPWADYDGED